jgi:hypothetical protein
MLLSDLPFMSATSHVATQRTDELIFMKFDFDHLYSNLLTDHQD